MKNSTPANFFKTTLRFASRRDPSRERFTEKRAVTRSSVAFVASLAIVASATGGSLVAEQVRPPETSAEALYSVVDVKTLHLNRTYTALQVPVVDLGPSGSKIASVWKPAAAIVRTINVAVRTSVKASGANNGQAAINAGGQVAVIWPGVGTIVSAHNFVDARALKLKAGDVVRFSGAVRGSYRVVNAINVPKGSRVSTVKKLGTTMMMQTCYFGTGTMRIVGLTKIG